jgi:hypothetical protein
MKWILFLLLPLSAFPEEDQPRKLRFFNLDLHASVIADVKNVLEHFGHEVVDWTLSEHAWIFGRNRDIVDIVNHESWFHMDLQMCEVFYLNYQNFLNQFDGFIVTHTPCFALLYEQFNKPIIIVNSSRYENPFTLDANRWGWLNFYLQNGVEKENIFIISNNKADQAYLKYYTGIDSVHIPSLCLYTQGNYTGNREGFIIHSYATFIEPVKEQLQHRHLIQNHTLQERYSWHTLYDYQGIIHFPYNSSTMSLFEQYSANVPLFFPTKRLLKQLRHHPTGAIMSQLSQYSIKHAPIPDIPGDPNNLNDEEVFNTWIDLADFYDEENMPYIQYFDSFQELDHLLKSADLKEISRKMKAHNSARKENALRKWEEILEKVKKN